MYGHLVVMACINIAIPFTLITWAEQSVDSAMAAILNSTFPLFVLLLERWLLARRWTGVEAATAALVSVGLVVLVPSFDPGDAALRGLAWGVLSGFTFALLGVRSRALAATHAPLDVALWQNAFAAAALVPWVALGPALAAPTWRVSDSQIQKLRIEVENSELEIEQATRDLAAGRRTVAAATNDLRVAERAIQRRRIEAPSDGVVVEVRRHVGEWVQPGEAVIRIVKDDRLRAEGFVHLDQLGASPLGQPAELVALLPGEGATRFQGTVTFVSPEANPINGQVRVWAEFDNRDGRLRAGLSARLIVKPAPATKP